MDENFKKGDRVLYNGIIYWNLVGVKGMVVDVENDDNVWVVFDDHDPKPVSCMGQSLVLVSGVEDNVKSEDPRTPEARYGDEVDALLHEYAEKMRKGFDGGTMAWPYSHLGLLAEFLMEYNEIEKP